MLLLGTIVSRLVGKLDRERTVGKGAQAFIGAEPCADGVSSASRPGDNNAGRCAPMGELEKVPTPEGAGTVIRDSREGDGITGHTAACPPARGDRPIGVATETADSARARPPENGICRRQVTRQPS